MKSGTRWVRSGSAEYRWLWEAGRFRCELLIPWDRGGGRRWAMCAMFPVGLWLMSSPTRGSKLSADTHAKQTPHQKPGNIFLTLNGSTDNSKLVTDDFMSQINSWMDLFCEVKLPQPTFRPWIQLPKPELTSAPKTGLESLVAKLRSHFRPFIHVWQR